MFTWLLAGLPPTPPLLVKDAAPLLTIFPQVVPVGVLGKLKPPPAINLYLIVDGESKSSSTSPPLVVVVVVVLVEKQLLATG